MSVMNFMKCAFVTDKDQLIHLSGSLLNSQNDQELSSVSNHHKYLKDNTQHQTGNLQIMKPVPMLRPYSKKY
jgi:hypothetical protein